MTQTQNSKNPVEVCKAGFKTRTDFREQLPRIIDDIVESCHDEACFKHIHAELIPSRKAVIEIVKRLRELLFPGYFSKENIDYTNLKYQMGQSVDALSQIVSQQITHSLRHECLRYDQPCIECVGLGYEEALRFLGAIPEMRKVLGTDVRAAYDGDPAAKSYDEIVFSYPGIFAIMVYRIAHQLFVRKIPLLPRIMTEYAHSITGIDIHPGAQIGESFFIDHGTGIVIGETAVIGKNVRLYQGVTLGALSLSQKAVENLREKKRHPTVEDDVIIYAGATILGEKAVIGARSVIGGNVWITEPVPPGTKVFLEAPRLIFK
ncbi:MAG: serine acetyltransferase [Desulfobacterales bacterium S7086C20]|nr:MAG: serine acetyltransferase [Desulfobacterales bacterium S7086C20]